ncbi:MAG: transcription antitermination protein NusB [Micrococcales bacterium]|nr:transcription antitermination protein NusB [Micrococcales bacterium]
MGQRTSARKRAFEVIFEADQRGQDPVELASDRELAPYSLELIKGVTANFAAIGEWLDTYSEGWPRQSMPAVDRALLYLGAYEVVYEDDVPDEVVFKECADLAAELSTAKSPNYVSGMLGRLSAIKDTLR